MNAHEAINACSIEGSYDMGCCWVKISLRLLLPALPAAHRAVASVLCDARTLQPLVLDPGQSFMASEPIPCRRRET